MGENPLPDMWRFLLEEAGGRRIIYHSKLDGAACTLCALKKGVEQE